MCPPTPDSVDPIEQEGQAILAAEEPSGASRASGLQIVPSVLAIVPAEAPVKQELEEPSGASTSSGLQIVPAVLAIVPAEAPAKQELAATDGRKNNKRQSRPWEHVSTEMVLSLCSIVLGGGRVLTLL